MDDNEKPIEGAENEQQQPNNERPAGQAEGSAPEPSADEVQSMYDDLGIKVKAPSGKSKGRPKTSQVRAKDDGKDSSGSAASGSAKNADDKDKSKNAPDSSKDGDSGDDSDAKGSKVGKDSGKVPSESEEADGGVRGSKSRDEGDSERAGKDGSEGGADGAGQEEHEQGAASDEGSEDGSEEEQGKRPGKSNPEVEKRFQKLTSEVKDRDQVIEDLQKQLREKDATVNKVKVSQEDPEYTIGDFRKVRDNKTGDILDLTPEQAELAWRRWKDGYDQRATERDAKANYATRVQEHQETQTRQLMKKSADAYDALAGLMDEYPELVSTSGKFDEDFAAEAMPIIQESIEYLPGTEPGNKEDKLPVIVGLRIDPNKILKALKGISAKKRNLPLNGVNDSVERGSSVSVPHSRSSDPNVNAANELYKELGINKRI